MKKLILAALVLLAICGCSKDNNNQQSNNNNNPSEKNNIIGYCSYYGIYNEDGDLVQSGKCNEVGMENTTLEITDGYYGKYTYYYEGRYVTTLNGKLVDCELDEDNYYACQMDFEEVDDYYAFAHLNGNYYGTLCTGFEGSTICWSFDEEKLETLDNTYEDDSEVEEEEVETSKPTQNTSGFLNSASCKEFTDTINESLPDLYPEMSYDEENQMYNVILYLPGSTVRNMKYNFADVEDTWYELTSNLNIVSEGGYALFVEDGYNVACTIMIVNEDDPDEALYASMNGEEVYNIADELN